MRLGTTANGRRFLGLTRDEMQRLADDVWRSVRGATGPALVFKWRRRRATRSRGGNGVIEMRQDSYSGESIIHEVAHALHWTPSTWLHHAGHGPEWARIMADLMIEHSPLTADQVYAAAAQAGVVMARESLHPVRLEVFKK